MEPIVYATTPPPSDSTSYPDILRDHTVYTIKLPPSGSTSYPDILHDNTVFASIVKSGNLTEFLFKGANLSSVTSDYAVWYQIDKLRVTSSLIAPWFGQKVHGGPGKDWLVARQWNVGLDDNKVYHWRTMEGDRLAKRELYQENKRLAKCINDSNSKSVELRCYDPRLENTPLLQMV